MDNIIFAIYSFGFFLPSFIFSIPIIFGLKEKLKNSQINNMKEIVEKYLNWKRNVINNTNSPFYDDLTNNIKDYVNDELTKFEVEKIFNYLEANYNKYHLEL